MFTEDGSFVRTFGSEGDGDGELDEPSGVCVDHTGRIIVADTNNERLQIFEEDGSFVCSVLQGEFGSSGRVWLPRGPFDA